MILAVSTEISYENMYGHLARTMVTVLTKWPQGGNSASTSTRGCNWILMHFSCSPSSLPAPFYENPTLLTYVIRKARLNDQPQQTLLRKKKRKSKGKRWTISAKYCHGWMIFFPRQLSLHDHLQIYCCCKIIKGLCSVFLCLAIQGQCFWPVWGQVKVIGSIHVVRNQHIFRLFV